uniref:Histone-binding protein RBBP4-like N-terminal domain-containing protein n=1 Tax=Chenopodium quinoa TaxID=63459 RepID=A0A803MRT4_CHEQI
MARSIKKPKKAKKKTKGSNNSEASSSSMPPARVWQPGVDTVGEDEELQWDPSAYNSYHAFHMGWPCLSFDIIQDTLGLVRTEFPHTIYVVAGTQADKPSLNSIEIFKLSNISGKKRDCAGWLIKDALIEFDPCHKVPTFVQLGGIQVWDFSTHLNFLAESTNTSRGGTSVANQAPLSMFRHKDEGYAMDWSPLEPGKLVTGDCQNSIYLWEPASGTKWNVDKNPFVGHTGSVEDLQWSPGEDCVFASASVDKTIAIWDTRLGKSPAMSFKAHDADVNVISWNRLQSYMLASGSDDGSFSIFNLKMIKDGEPMLAHFTHHKHPITSIEWSPHEDSVLAVSSADHQLTIWDLALERDEEEEAEFKSQIDDKVDAPEELPPQLLFVHQGQKDLKELHWHAQIPGMIISTAADGFNVLMPSNVERSLPANGA